jgi:hypothetical protein
MQAIPCRNARAEAALDAKVIDLAQYRASRLLRRTSRAAQHAAAALARLEAGRAAWPDLAAALVSPYNG